MDKVQYKELLVFVRKRRLRFGYVCHDGWYAAGWFVRWQRRRRIVGVTQLPCDRQVEYRGQVQRVDALAAELQYRRGRRCSCLPTGGYG